MVTPDDIKKKALAKYGAFLANDFETETSKFFPLEIRCDKSMSFSNLKELERGITLLQFSSTEKKAFGYDITYVEKNTKLFGKQNIPLAISFRDETNYLKFIGKEKETKIFRSITKQTLNEFPDLQDALLKNHAEVVKNALEWDNVLRVCRYFREHPQPHLFVREMNMGVHTKFVETHTKILRPLLDVIVGEEMVNPQASTFYGHFHLKEGDPHVWFRILDENMSQKYFSGLSYVAAYIFEMAKLNLPVQQVFIVENKANMEFFPMMKNTIVIWGEGYKVTVLKDVNWLRNVKIYYWGDIDVQGFEILSDIRQHFPHIQSVMMDEVAITHHPVKVEGNPSKVETPRNLSDSELAVYDKVKAANSRYEQELLPHDYVQECLSNYF